MKNSTLCGKMVFKKGMSEPRPCMRKKHRGSTHTADLTGMKNAFGFAAILERGSDYIRSGTHYRQTRWRVLDKFGNTRLVFASDLFKGVSAGKYVKSGSDQGCIRAGRPKKEYNTISSHWQRVFDPNNRDHRASKHMLFCDEWNPRKGGSKIVGTRWIEKNLPCPGPDYELHVIKTKKCPHGYFGPGGIEWRHKMDRHDQDLIDHIYEMPEQNLIDLREEIDRLLKSEDLMKVA